MRKWFLSKSFGGNSRYSFVVSFHLSILVVSCMILKWKQCFDLIWSKIFFITQILKRTYVQTIFQKGEILSRSWLLNLEYALLYLITSENDIDYRLLLLYMLSFQLRGFGCKTFFKTNKNHACFKHLIICLFDYGVCIDQP